MEKRKFLKVTNERGFALWVAADEVISFQQVHYMGKPPRVLLQLKQENCLREGNPSNVAVLADPKDVRYFLSGSDYEP